ncbi:SDR family NAD(P)-dependent oxidoreductase [soil metagenome]
MSRVFITGSSDGLGLAAARDLLSQGHDVVLHARSEARAQVLREQIGAGAPVVIGDLANGREVRRIAEQVNAFGAMDAVIHNAGIYVTPERGDTPEGHATVFAVNTLASFVLTALIQRPQRLIYLSSGLHRDGEGSLTDPDWKERTWQGGKAYAETKLQVAALAAALARRWPGVLTGSVDPGWVPTRMGGAGATGDLQKGHQTQAWLAASREAANAPSGAYWFHRKEQKPAGEVTDVAFQDRLIEQLAALTGVTLPNAQPN